MIMGGFLINETLFSSLSFVLKKTITRVVKHSRKEQDFVQFPIKLMRNLYAYHLKKLL